LINPSGTPLVFVVLISRRGNVELGKKEKKSTCCFS